MRTKVELNTIYLESSGTLSSRIDSAWQAYNDGENYTNSERHIALEFLM